MAHEYIINLAKTIKSHGGKLLLVGGCVRDEHMGIAPKDFDCEVYGIPFERLQWIVTEFDSAVKADMVGKSFQVFKLSNNVDLSIPRRDRKVGDGHTGFEVEGDPYMSYKEACSRRDFTINAILKDPLTGDYIDPFDGVNDINARELRCVSPETFTEDPLRILRLIQFASRLEFIITQHTWELATKTASELKHISKERVFIELEKLILKSKEPLQGFRLLHEITAQTTIFYGWNFHLNTIKSLVTERKLSKYIQTLSKEEYLALVFTYVLSQNSDTEDVKRLIDAFGIKSKFISTLILNLLENYCNTPTDYELCRIATKLPMRCYKAYLDCLDNPNIDAVDRKINDLGLYDGPIKPFITGEDLLNAGYVQSKSLGDKLAELYDLQLKGLSEEELWGYI
jgi:tRNA nucleotidyltransferase (CCA-adding enzyme)